MNRNVICQNVFSPFFQRTFKFSSSLWTDRLPYNDINGQGLSDSEVKTKAYWTVPFQKICIGMKFVGNIRWIKIEYQSSSLYHLIADGQYRSTQIGRQNWKSLISGSSLQPNCNREGFNVVPNGFPTNRLQHVRIGIIANEQNDCRSCDSSLGLGGDGNHGQESSGNVAKYGGDNGDRNTATWGYVFVQ